MLLPSLSCWTLVTWLASDKRLMILIWRLVFLSGWLRSGYVEIGLPVWYTQVWVCEDWSSSLVFSGLGTYTGGIDDKMTSAKYKIYCVFRFEHKHKISLVLTEIMISLFKHSSSDVTMRPPRLICCCYTLPSWLSDSDLCDIISAEICKFLHWWKWLPISPMLNVLFTVHHPWLDN